MDPIPKSEIPDLLAAADIGVHCLANVEMFRTGVSPNKLFDYMAAGLPAITNTPGVCSDFVLASRGGRAVPPDGLAGALVELASLSADARSDIGRLGREHLDATRSRSAMVTRLQVLLDDIVPPQNPTKEIRT